MTNPWYGSPLPPDWQALYQRWQQLEQQLNQALSRMDAMQKELDELKSKPPIHVEYHFDQLKVSKLDGTLNIGLSPQAMQGGVESFEVPAPGMWSAPADPKDDQVDRIRSLQKEAADYVERTVPVRLGQLAAQRHLEMDPQHTRIVVDDIKSQLGGRVHYYARTAPYSSAGTEEERRQWKQTVLDKTYRDVDAAIAGYVSNLGGPASAEGGTA